MALQAAAHEAMDLDTVAGLLGRSTRQVNNYIRLNGLPSRDQGRRRTFVWTEVLEWYVGYRMELEMGGGNDGNAEDDSGDAISDSGGREDIRAANLRKTRAEANLKELQLSKLRGQVIVIADVRMRLDRLFGNLRSRLLSLAPKLSSRIEGMATRTEREAAIKQELENLCQDVSTGSIVDLPAEAKAAEDDTADANADEEEDEPLTLEASASAIDPGADDGLTDKQRARANTKLLKAYDSLQP